MTEEKDVLPIDENLTEIKNNYENIIKKIELELESYKEEQAKLKEQVLGIIEKNQKTSSDCNRYQPTTSSEEQCWSEHEQLTDEAISNLTRQVEHLNEERCTIQQLWKTSQDTVSNLETEIQNYRKQLFKPSAFVEIKEQYLCKIKNLENKVQCQKNELCKVSQIINDLKCERCRALNRVKELEAKLQEQQNTVCENQELQKIVCNLKQKLEEALKHNSELELSTNLTKSMMDERFLREKCALEKLQEALLIADTAVAEKEEAFKREMIIKEECETLARTIGQVMEEAAEKAEKTVDNLRAQYEEKQKCLMEKNSELICELERQANAKCIAENQRLSAERRCNEVIEANNRLDTELQIANQTLRALELKVNATERLIEADKRSSKCETDQEAQLKQYMENNRQLKERWKNTIEDVTKKFSCEIQKLQQENAKLKADIHAQRFGTTENPNY